MGSSCDVCLMIFIGFRGGFGGGGGVGGGGGRAAKEGGEGKSLEVWQICLLMMIAGHFLIQVRKVCSVKKKFGVVVEVWLEVRPQLAQMRQG